MWGYIYNKIYMVWNFFEVLDVRNRSCEFNMVYMFMMDF